MARHGIRNIEKAEARMRQYAENIDRNTMSALRQCAAFVRTDMETTPPKVPVDTGNLRASWFTSAATNLQNKEKVLTIGFNANYAAFVHEMTYAKRGKIKWNRKGSGPKFFEYALKRNFKKFMHIIKGELT